MVVLSGVNSEVVVTVAWEISWYQYRVSPESENPVRLEGRGHDPSELETFPSWEPERMSDRGVHVVLECSGKKAAIEAGFHQLRRGGVLVMVGAGIEHPTFDPNRMILNELHVCGSFVYDLDGKSLRNGKRFVKLDIPGGGGASAADGIRCDVDGNVWCGARPGVQIVTPNGERIGMIRLPETCANISFGGSKRNRLFMAASQSLYSVYVNTTGAHIA